MNDQPRIETCSCSNVNTLFASFSARSHTKPHTKNQQQQRWTILSTIEATSKQQQQNIVRLRFHKSREPAVLSSASGVFFSFSFVSVLLCVPTCARRTSNGLLLLSLLLHIVCLFVIALLLLLLSFVSSRHFFPMVLFWTRFYRRQE